MEMVEVKRMRPSISQSQMPSDSKVMKHKLSTCLAQTIVGTVWVLAEPLHITWGLFPVALAKSECREHK